MDAFEIFGTQLRFRRASGTPHGNDTNTHGRSANYVTHHQSRFSHGITLGLPKLLDGIVFADIGSKQMDDHIARIDQDPIAIRPALRSYLGEARFLELFHNMPGHRTNFASRATTSDHHIVCEIRLSGQWDHRGALGLIVVQRLLDQGQNAGRGRQRPMTIDASDDLYLSVLSKTNGFTIAHT